MNKKLFFPVVISLLMISFLSCNNNDNIFDDREKENEDDDPSIIVNDDNPLLPTLIIDTYNLNADPFYDHTDSTLFTYDNNNRLTGMTYLQWQTYYKGGAPELVYRNNITLEYKGDGTVIRTDNYTRTEGGDNTDIRIYKPTELVIQVSLNDKYTETMELKDNLVIKHDLTYPANDGENIHHSTHNYTYNDKGDIKQYHYSFNDYNAVYEYTYNNYNGIFKHVNIPQWLKIALFKGDYLQGHFNNNIKAEFVVRDDTKILLTSREYEYNPACYPIERIVVPSTEWVGIWGRKSTFEYTPVK